MTDHPKKMKVNFRMLAAATLICFCIVGFGIYLGRYLRWNSWDVLLNPGELFQDIAVRLTQPLSYPYTWFISFLSAALVLFSHLIFSRFCEYKHSKKDLI